MSQILSSQTLLKKLFLILAQTSLRELLGNLSYQQIQVAFVVYWVNNPNESSTNITKLNFHSWGYQVE